MSAGLLHSCLACALLISSAVRAASGDLDTTFHSPFGYTTYAFDLGGNNADPVQYVLIQPGGGIVLVGTATVDAALSQVALVRLFPDGTLDSSFGTGGSTHVFVSHFGQVTITGAALDANGSIYVTGYSVDSAYHAFLGHFTSSGDLDTAFAGSGFAVVSSSYPLLFYNVAVDSSGKPVVVGTDAFEVLAVRYGTSGLVDPAFNNGTAFVQPIGTGAGPFDSAWSVTFDSVGRIYLGAEAGTGGGSFQLEHPAMVRLTADGFIDNTCNGNGIVPFADFSNYFLEPVSILFRDAHHVILTGSMGSNGFLYAVDFDADDCTLKSSQVSGGVGGHSGHAVVASDGAVYVSYTSNSSSPQVAQILALHDGLPYAGQAFTASAGTISLGAGIALFGGRPLQAIQQQVSGTNYDFAVARFENDRIFYANFDRDAPN